MSEQSNFDEERKRITELEERLDKYMSDQGSFMRWVEREHYIRENTEERHQRLQKKNRGFNSLLIGSLITLSTSLGVLSGDAFDPFKLSNGLEATVVKSEVAIEKSVQSDELPTPNCLAAVSAEAGVLREQIQLIASSPAAGNAQTYVLKVPGVEVDEFWFCLVDRLTGGVSSVWRDAGSLSN